MPKHYVLTDAGLKPDDGSSQIQNVGPSDSSTFAQDVQPVPSAPPSSSQTFDLRAVAREVQALGALHLDRKREAKSFKEAHLSKLGVKLPSKPRLSAKIGLGAHKKGKLLDEQREQDLIDSGMKSLRGRGKRKAASQKKKPKDKGLNEAKGYKAGLMHVKPAAMKSSGAKGRGQPHKLGKGRGKKKQ